jgi:hypothetical protein
MIFSIPTLLALIPSAWQAVKKIRDINRDPVKHITKHIELKGKQALKKGEIETLDKPDLNELKKEIATSLIQPTIPSWMIKRGWKLKDTERVIDCICSLLKLLNKRV